MKKNSPTNDTLQTVADPHVPSSVGQPVNSGIPDRREIGYIAGTASTGEAEAFEQSLADEPLYLAHIQELRGEVVAMTTPEKLDALGERLRREVEEAMAKIFPQADSIPSNIMAEPTWDTEKNVVAVCFRPVAEGLGGDKINRTETLQGPGELLDSDGKRYPVQVTERQTEQGDVWIAAEADCALAGRTLHLRGRSKVILPLRLERGKAFGVVVLSWDEYSAFCPRAGEKFTCEQKLDYDWE